MDLDGVSNCSSFSNPSDEIISNASNLSDLSTYQDEFTKLHHLVNPIKYPFPVCERCSTPKPDSGCELPYDNRISNLTCQLDNSLKLNEKYKYDLYNLEKNIELKFYDKIDKLLKSNLRLKSELDNANSQIGRLIKNYCTKQDTSVVSEEKYIQLEEQYHELSLQNSTLQFDVLQIRNENEEYGLQNKQLKIELNEIKIEYEAKTACIKGLKEKISQQYQEIQTFQKNNVKSTQVSNELSNELEHIRKIQEWYKEQLHLCQKDKRVLSNEVLKYKTDLSIQNEATEKLRLELAKCKNKCDVIQLEALKEKQKLWKQLEENVCQHQTQSVSIQNDHNYVENNENSIRTYYEGCIQDLTNELIKIKDYVQEQDNTIKQVSKENAKLLAQCITLQKTMQQNESTIEELENNRKRITVELNRANDKIKEKTDEISSQKLELLNINAELNIRKEENVLIETAIKTVKEQFYAFKSKYIKMEEELINKNKKILQLETEKQKLFMDNNWSICELEKYKEKDLIINNLKVIINNCEKNIADHLADINRLESELQERENIVITLGEEKQTIMNNTAIEIHKYEDVFMQYKIMVTSYENKINELQKLLSHREMSVIDLKDNIKLLKEELNKRDTDLSTVNTQCTFLQNKLTKYEKDRTIKFTEDSEYYVKKLISKNDFNFTNILHHFMNVCKLYNTNKNDDCKLKELAEFSSILKTIEKCIHNPSNNIDIHNKDDKSLKITGYKLKNEIEIKLGKLSDRINVLNDKIENCCKTLNTVTCFKEMKYENERVEELNVLLQVKEREMKEKQRKYEINYHTLLRKVKEHMKGRNAAEKQNKYLQELYNSLSDENNSLKLSSSSKDYEIDNNKKQLESYIHINHKLNQTIRSLEESSVKNKRCDSCVENTAAIEQLKILKKSVEILENEKKINQNTIKFKEDAIANLHREIKEILLKNANMVNERDTYKKKFEDTQNDKVNLANKINILGTEMKDKHRLVEELTQILKEENIKNVESSNEIYTLKNHISQLHDKIEYLSKEIEILNSTLQSKSEELQQLEIENCKIESVWANKSKESEKTIDSLKKYLYEMQAEMNSVNSEKHFLQRLCNDLKLALRTYVNHNKALKEQLHVSSKQKEEFNSLPNMLLDMPTITKYDDAYINQLLQQNQAPMKDKPLTEIKGCLDNLRKEISILQEEIVKKNIGR